MLTFTAHSVPIFFYRNSDDSVWVDYEPWVVDVVEDAIVRFQDCPARIPGFADEIPACEGSFCPVYRTMACLKALWDTVGHDTGWSYVLESSPSLSSSEESAVNTIMDFVEGWRLFSWLSYLRRRTIAKGIFVANLNDYDNHGLPLAVQKLTTTFVCGPAPTTSSCPSVTVDYIYATPTYSEVIVSTQRLNLAIMR